MSPLPHPLLKLSRQLLRLESFPPQSHVDHLETSEATQKKKPLKEILGLGSLQRDFDEEWQRLICLLREALDCVELVQDVAFLEALQDAA